MVETIKNQLEIKELELNALLEITQSVNMNLPEESLYKIYHFTLRANLNIKKLALYVFNEQWNCEVNFGTLSDYSEVILPSKFLNQREINRIDQDREDSSFKEFDTYVPVAHKDRLLAVVFVGSDELETNTDFIQALTNFIIVAIENKKLGRRQLEQQALKKELEIASQVQQLLFPKSLPNKKNLQIEATYFPHHRVGGDYYDYLPIDENRFLVCIADVSGKGVPAAILMSNFQASLRTLVRKTTNLKEIVEELNYQIMQNAKGENFITFFLAVYDRSQKVLNYVNAGHNPPVLVCPKRFMFLDSGTTILGAFSKLPFLNEGKVEDLEKFLFFAYTDGLTETENDSKEYFGTKRLEVLLKNNREEELTLVHQNILAELDQFRGKNEYADDITFLSCRVEP
ncbi:GAF domain-containing SpoIIE family protein phosphatase [Xanthovirga aplysinae]|uniref:GAF domain-containing SpoIIE family protein phosphatase n=1 Tax=Xanthovirga aplysinae TaxID=2529853 RepID=UPI0012BC3812|nr:PP2C family protein-serine/threonine phosphatase [Xanthovirga aplysinae]MTI32784.1 hypothetical protein [Xanthovirga aplysinae]